MPKTETAITDHIIAWLKICGGDGFKILGTVAQRGGEPDITGEFYSEVLGRWIHLKLEVKTPVGTASARQLMRIELYQKRGYCAGFVRSNADVAGLIADYERQAKKALDWLE